jgi:hypothetical protein
MRRRLVIRTSEVPKLRRCLAEGHNHLFLTVKAIRICPRGRLAQGAIDPLYGAVSAMSRRMRDFRPYSGLTAYARETT